jgi:hypothetical protein
MPRFALSLYRRQNPIRNLIERMLRISISPVGHEQIFQVPRPMGCELIVVQVRTKNDSGRNRDRLVSSLSNYLTQGTKSGVFASQVEPRTVAGMILDALEGHGLCCLSLPSTDTAAKENICSFILKDLVS